MHVLNYIEENVDIYKMPAVHQVLKGMHGDEILIGDLHANPLKLIYFLIRHGVVSGLTADEYLDLVTICTKRGEDITEADLTYYKLLLNGLAYKADVCVNLGGDNAADRHKGPAEIFIMLLIKELHEHDVLVKNYISNHDAEWIEVCELGLVGDDLQAPRLSAKDSRSIRETDILLKKGLVTKEELLALYNDHYKMTLRVAGRFIDTSFDDDPLIYVVTHAAVDIDTIRKAAEYLDPDAGGYAINSFPRLMKVMDVVDKKFQLVVDGNWVHELWDPKAMKNAYERCCDLRNDPFVCSMWNRVYKVMALS